MGANEMRRPCTLHRAHMGELVESTIELENIKKNHLQRLEVLLFSRELLYLVLTILTSDLNCVLMGNILVAIYVAVFFKASSSQIFAVLF